MKNVCINNANKRRIIAVIGTTASGKSDTALEIAKRIDGEIISGDSMQIYRRMDIGTAKPDMLMRSEIPHHLIDIADITEKFSLERFISQAKQAVDSVLSRGKVPIIAGGTGMYVEMLIKGVRLADGESDSALRNALEAEQTESLYARLAEIDPESAFKIHKNNRKRVIRAIEIFMLTGKTKTQLDKESLLQPPLYESYIAQLQCESREETYERIDRRVDIMLDMGLEAEVKALYEQGIEQTPTASQAIGYKEFFPYFKGECCLIEVTERIKQATRNYAKRQLTYFGHMENRHIFAASSGAADMIIEGYYD